MRREVSLSLMLALISGTAVAIMSYQMFAVPVSQPSEVVMGSSIDLSTVVVSKMPLTYGAPVLAENLAEVKWPTASVPPGTFKTIKELFEEQATRSALQKIDPGEAIARGRVTGPGQRASLAALLTDGKKAVSMRVNEVVGVSGFVLPNDRVDVLLTRSEKQAGEGQQPYIDILLQDMKVLAVDQLADTKVDQPKLVRTVTVEATLAQAQMITLAASVGELSLVLREEGKISASKDGRRITVADLAGDSGDKGMSATFQPTMAVAPEAPQVAPNNAEVTIKVVRSVTSTDYSIKRSIRDR